jgi:hypothetical protein
MSKNQLHGKKYEDYLKLAFSDSINEKYNNQWDVDKSYDNDNNLPTQIKTTGSNYVDLADARRFWLIQEPYRLLIAKYEQLKNIKQFNLLYEFNISIEEHSKLLGDITYNEIKDFHNNLINYKTGFHSAARVFAQEKKILFALRSIIKLNPKIDSKNQRRLQCSININSLLINIKEQNIYSGINLYRGININYNIESGKREFNK